MHNYLPKIMPDFFFYIRKYIKAFQFLNWLPPPSPSPQKNNNNKKNKNNNRGNILNSLFSSNKVSLDRFVPAECKNHAQLKQRDKNKTS